jgi:SAM-dependent methyltransferase
MAVDIAVIRKLPEPFNFYSFLVSAGHLHFGYWSDDYPDASLEEAQKKMFVQLLAFFPRPPASVLDVGCGLGVSAHSLSRQGYEVTGIAPSSALIDHAAECFGDECTTFQVADFLGDADAPFMEQSYDVIFFQESLQYLPFLDVVFQRCRALLNSKGIIIIGDEIRYDDSLKDQTAVHSHREVLLALHENGFRLTQHRQIGSQVKKTCGQVIDAFTRDFDHIVSAVGRPDAADRLHYFLEGWKSQQEWYAAGRMGYELFVARKDPVFIRFYREGDEEQILPMFNRIFFQQRTLEHWRWKYRDNPFGSHKIVVAVDGEGSLAGHFAAYPVPYHSPASLDAADLVFHGGDTMTNPEFRHLGRGKTSVLSRMFSYFYPKFCEGNIPYIYGYNTATIRKLGERYLGYEYTSPVSLYALNVEQKRVSCTATGGLRKLFSGFSVVRVAGVGEAYDHFFERVGDEYQSLVKRSALYLQWRYFDCPDTDYHVFAVKKRGKLVGWAVFKPQGQTLVWGDALFDQPFAAVAAPMLINKALKFFSRDITRIEAWFSPAPSWWAAILDRMGFVPEPEPNNLAPAYKIFDRNFSVDFFEKHHYYTMGDSDLF